MKTNRIVSIVLMASLLFPVSGLAQKAWEKVLGGAVVGAAVIGSLAGKKKKDKSADEVKAEVVETASEADEVSASSRPERVTGLKIVTNHPDLEIKLKRCQVSGKTCVIDFVMTNYGNDTKIDLYGSSSSDNSTAFDDEGNEYEFAVQATNSGLTYNWINPEILTDVPIKCRIQIEGVASSATMFKRIMLAARCDALGLYSSKPIMFYNVPITREGDE